MEIEDIEAKKMVLKKINKCHTTYDEKREGEQIALHGDAHVKKTKRKKTKEEISHEIEQLKKKKRALNTDSDTDDAVGSRDAGAVESSTLEPSKSPRTAKPEADDVPPPYVRNA